MDPPNRATGKLRKATKLLIEAVIKAGGLSCTPKDDAVDYGWIPKNVLINCVGKDGTP
jgi:hypothetical protein